MDIYCHDGNMASPELKDRAQPFSQLRTVVEKQRKRTCDMFQIAMENVERRGRETKDKLTSEFRSAIVEVEKKRLKTKTILTQATHEILTAMEEKKQNQHKTKDLHGGRVISVEAVHKFKGEYEYNATCGSVLELLFLQRFWIRLSQTVPRWIMPCSITFCGLAINLISCGILIYYSPDGTSEVPAWSLVVCSVGLFVYQTLDALDGKQAMKLQNTPLEEFADHGSDSLSTSFVILSVAISMKLGTNPGWLAALCFTALIAFYSTHWQTYVTNVVVFGKVDVTEAQCAIMVSHLITAYFGSSVWQYEIDYIGLEVRFLVALCIFAMVCIGVAGNLRIIAGAETPLASFVKIPRRKGVSIMYPGIPILLWLILVLYTQYTLLPVSPCLFCVFYGVLFTKLLLKLQVATLGGTDNELWDPVLCVPFLLAVNQHMGLVPPFTSLLGGMIFVTMDMLRYATYLAWDICDFQDIFIFTLKHPLGHPLNKAGSHGVYVNGINNSQVMAEVAASHENSLPVILPYNDAKPYKHALHNVKF